jgi:hypothetical protein
MRSTALLVCLSGLALVSESQEIQMGLEADPGVVTSMGLDPDSGRQRYAKRIVGDPLP